MCRRPEALVWGAEPIAGVVLGVHPTAAEVGDLVMQITVLGSATAKNLIIAQGIVLVDGWHLAQFDLFGQDGVGLQGERVGREVGEVQFEEKVEVTVPLLGIGDGEAINQVDADVTEACLFGPFDALSGVNGVVATAQVVQVVVEEALDADAEPVDTKSALAFEVVQGQCIGVGLKGDFGIAGHGIVLINKVQQLADFFHRKQRWGAATEVDGINY